MIRNPIIPGFNPDPCICRKGEDYYLAVSTFEWMPGLPVYHSRDLKNWELYTHVLTDDEKVDLKKLPSAKGIWAPCLTYCEKEDLFHDDDGRKYLVALEWETREGYEKPGAICMVEYDPGKQEIIGYPKRIWRGGTDRGCIEAPHLTKKNGCYYIMCAEGGTGYNHCVTMGRSAHVWGPYEKDPQNPILTSVPGESYERHNPDHLKPKYYNPESVLQKSGHGSYVETPAGEVYMVYHTSRPFVPELCCTLGRETAIQKMQWTSDGWLRSASGSNLAQEETPESSLPECPLPKTPDFDDFDGETLGNWYYAPRIMPERFADLKARPGYVRIRGQESRTSLNKVSILARKLTSVYARVTTKMEFVPVVHQHSAGLILYYDNMNYINLRKYYSETLGGSALSIIHLENGVKTEFLNTRIPVKDCPIYLRLWIQGRKSWFEWSYDGETYTKIGRIFETAKFSDEYCQYGEFTGTMVGLTCADRVKHQHYADFDFFEYIADETKPVD